MDDRTKLNLYRGIKSGAFNERQKLNAYRAIKSNAPNEDVADLLGSLSFASVNTGKSLNQLVDERQGRDRDNFDYSSGADGRLRSLMSFGETEQDREAILKSIVGDDGYVRDPSGKLALTAAGQKIRGMEPTGKNLVIEDEGFSMRDFSDFAGVLPETVGSIAGAIAGGGLTFGVGSIAGAGAGAAAGQAIEESIESLLGVQTQNLSEVAKDVAIEGLIGAGGEVLGAAVVAAGRGTIGGAKALAGRAVGAREAGEELAEQQVALGERLVGKDYIPSLESLGAKKLGYGQKFVENAAKEMQRVKNNTNIALAEKNEILSKISGNPAVDLADDITWYAPGQFAKLSKGIDNANRQFIKEFDKSLGFLGKSIDENIDLNTETLSAITRTADAVNNSARQDFTAVGNLLSNIQEPVYYGGSQVIKEGGDLKLFNTNSIEAPLKEYMSEMRNLADPAAIQADVFLKGTRGAASFKDMANLRKSINDSLYFGGNVSTKAHGVLEGVLRQIDTMMDSKTLLDDLVDESGRPLINVSTLSKESRMYLSDAMNLRKKAMNNYREGMKRLEKLKDFSIIKSTKDLVSINGELPRATSDKLFQKVIQPNSPDRLDAVLKAVDNPNQVQDMLSRSYVDEALRTSGFSEIDPTSFNGKKFSNKILNLGSTGPKLFGPDWKDVKKIAESIRMADVSGKISADDIMRASEAGASQGVADSLSNVLSLVKQESDFLKTSVLKDLKEGRSVAQDDVVKLLTNRSLTPSDAQRIMKFFDNNPQLKENMKNVVLMDIMDSVDGKVFESAANANKLQKTIDGYKQGTLKVVLGDDTYKALNQMAEELTALGDTTKEGAIAAGSLWAQLFKHPVGALSRIGQMKLAAKALSSPVVAKSYVAGQRAKLNARQAGRAVSEGEVPPILAALNQSMIDQGGVDVQKLGSTAGRIAQGVGTVTGQAGRANVQTTPRALGLGSFEQPGQTRTNVQRPRTEVPQIDIPEMPVTRTAPAQPMGPIQQLQRNVQSELRRRAKENPAVAATLLGGLGSAGLL